MICLFNILSINIIKFIVAVINIIRIIIANY